MVENNISLKKYNSFGIEARAEYFGVFDSVISLAGLLEFKADNSINESLVLGGGSNILLTRDFAGLVLKNEISGIEKVGEDDEFVYVRAGAGESWHAFVLHCISHDYAGAENLSLIPGNVGASPMQNIGAYGVEIKDIFHELEAFDIAEETVRKFSKADCEFGYRESVFKNKLRNRFIILSVTFQLRKDPQFQTSYGAIEEELQKKKVSVLSIKAVSDAVINIRKSKLPDPKTIGNAGSFFKNPVLLTSAWQAHTNQFPQMPGYAVNDTHTKVPAGWLIEQCGWKGYRRGDAGCHPRQALVLVNYAHATGPEILALAGDIQKSVRDKFDIEIEKEVNII